MATMHAHASIAPCRQAGPGLRAWAHAWWVIAASVLAGVARGQMTSGDILLNVFNGTPRVECFRSDGTHRWTTSGGTGNDWLGCAVTRQGHVVVTRRIPGNGVNVFD